MKYESFSSTVINLLLDIGFFEIPAGVPKLQNKNILHR
jgi:hypothetical protein